MNAEPQPPAGAPGPEELALAYAERCGEGRPPPLEEFLARLATQAERDEFLALVEALRQAERALPSPPRPIASDQLVAGRYQLVRRLGAGGMGQVWEARDRQLDRRVAIKFLDSASQGLVEREELFQKESRLLASLQHPGIVAVHEYGRDGGLTYIVMDLVDGRALSDVLEAVRSDLVQHGALFRPRDAALLARALGRPRPLGRTSLVDARDWFRCVARIALELARIVEAAHGQRVIHRDLKPSNVMLTGGGNPVVLDFGLAGSFERAHGVVTHGLYGSMAYLAPEQARSHTVGLDPRTDVYQLGLILYELLTLQRTFPGEAIGDVLERIQLGRFPVPRSVRPDVPRELEAICLRALELDPARRYASARELAADLERWISGRELPHALGAGGLRRALRRVRWHVRQRPWLSGFAGLVLASAAWWTLRPAQVEPIEAGQAVRVDAHNVAHPLADNGLVQPGEYLGMYLRCREPAWVWALSVYGPDEQHKRVSAWRAMRLAAPGGTGREDAPFALALPVGDSLVLGTRLDPAPNSYEALMLLVTTEEDERIESWARDLDNTSAGNGYAGVEWSGALLKLRDALRARGAFRPGTDLTESELDGLIHTRHVDDPFWEKLPGVRTFSVECRGR